MSRVAERDEADSAGKPEHPLLANATLPEDEPEPLSLKKLWSDYLASRVQAGFIKDERRRQAPVIKNLRTFLKHDDARRVTK